MAKIGTAHVEIKPVINDEALETITRQVEEAVAEGVRRGMRALPAYPPSYPSWWVTSSDTATSGLPLPIEVDGKELRQVVVKANREHKRRTGENPLG